VDDHVYRPPVPGTALDGLGITLLVTAQTLTGAEARFMGELTNLSNDAQITVPGPGSFSFGVRVWDSSGREIRDIRGFQDRYRLGRPPRRDWVTLNPHDSLSAARVVLYEEGAMDRLPPGRYRAAVAFSGNQRHMGARIVEVERAVGEDDLAVWTPPADVDNVAEIQFEVETE